MSSPVPPGPRPPRTASFAGRRVPHLQFYDADRLVLGYRLPPGRTVVGRSDRCDVALPSETVSRRHCVVEQRADGWWVRDTSRHGTWLDGERIEEAPLAPGCELRLGAYRARYVERSEGAADVADGVSATRLVRPADHEELLALGEDGPVTARAVLRAVAGPLEGHGEVLHKSRFLVGGPGSDWALDPDLPQDAARFRVVRGRVLVEPGAVPVFLEGLRVRELTPVLVGETLRLGPHAITVEARTIRDDRPTPPSFGALVGSSAPMRALYGVLERMARHDHPILLSGASGTGKELAARALHAASVRHDGAFVALNAASLPEALVESSLFGHVRGSFTGADRDAAGAFQQADGGTLFLDELGEMSLAVQAKLLRALESGEVIRVGATRPEYPDVRVIAATHRNLRAMVREGSFREDLYFRLAVLTVRLPSLTERLDDLPELCDALLARHHAGARITADGLQALRGHPWRGNVRELRNVLTRAVVLGGPVVSSRTLSFDPLAFDDAPPPSPPAEDREALERTDLVAALDATGGNRAAAARRLGIPRTSLLYRMRKYGLR